MTAEPKVKSAGGDILASTVSTTVLGFAADSWPKNANCRTPVQPQGSLTTLRFKLRVSPPRYRCPLSTGYGLSVLAPAQRVGGVLGMLSSLEVKVFCPT
jgi:hypothetical protein